MGESDMRPFQGRVPVATGDDRKSNAELSAMRDAKGEWKCAGDG
jgi:hypothetical protein